MAMTMATIHSHGSSRPDAYVALVTFAIADACGVSKRVLGKLPVQAYFLTRW